MPKILQMKDMSDSFVIKKDPLPSIPFRGTIIGKSGSGKTGCLGAILLLPEFYGNDFKGEDMYIFSPMKNDFKMKTIIEYKEIPNENLVDNFDDSRLGELYEELVEQFEEDIRDGMKPSQKLIILDDLSYGNIRKPFNNLSRVMCNGRKQNISVLITGQLYTHLSPCVRENSSFFIIYRTSLKNLELIESEHNYLKSKKMFLKMFNENCPERHNFLVINYGAKFSDMYLDESFEVIDQSKLTDK